MRVKEFNIQKAIALSGFIYFLYSIGLTAYDVFERGEAFEDNGGDPPGTKRDKNGRLRDEKTGRFVVDPIVGRRKATEFYTRHNPQITDRQLRSHLNGIDFTRPVNVVTIRSGTSLTQYTRYNTEGTPIRGDYYSDNPNATPNELGVSDEYNVPDASRNFTQQIRNSGYISRCGRITEDISRDN